MGFPHGSRALLGGDLALTGPARLLALAHRSRSEGDREGRRGEEGLNRLVGGNVWAGGIGLLGQGGRLGCRPGGAEAGVTAEPGKPGPIHVEDQRHHRLCDFTRSPEIVRAGGQRGSAEAHRHRHRAEASSFLRTRFCTLSTTRG